MKRKTMLGPMPTFDGPKSSPNRIDPEDPFRIAAQGVRGAPAPHHPTTPPEQTTLPPGLGKPQAPFEPANVPPTPPALPAGPSQKKRRQTVVTLERPEQPSVAGVALLLPAEGPAVALVLREGRTRIGRRPDAEIVVDDPKASGDHALLRLENGEAWLLDTSANGTSVSGVLCVNDRAELQDGSILRIGDTVVVLKLLTQDTLTALAGPL